MVLSATLSTVLSSTIAIRLVIRTPRMTHRRRYTMASVSASGATPEAPACGETPGSSMLPLQVLKPAPWPVHPGRARRPGKAKDTERSRIAIYSRFWPGADGPARRARAAPPGLSPAGAAWHAEGVRGRHTGATRQEDFP